MIVKGPPSTRYIWQPITLAGQLERTAAMAGNREALICDDRRLTWSDVRKEARTFAKALLASGIGNGDHFAVWLPNQVEWIIAWLASSYIGAVVIPLNTRYKKEEVGYILRQSDSKLLFLRDTFLGIDFAKMLDELLPLRAGVPDTRSFPELRGAIVLGRSLAQAAGFDRFLTRGAEISEEELDRRSAEVRFNQPTIIVYTSGTTGQPKGAVHSHCILRNECSITEWMGIGPESRIMGHMPFFHVAGAFSGILPAMISGGALVLMDHWDVAKALQLIERERVSSFSGIPTHFIDLLTHPTLTKYDLSSLDSGWIGGASNPPEVLDGVMNKLGIRRLLPVYGMTETTSVTTFPRPDDARDVILTGKGVPVSDFELKVVDAKSGVNVAVGVEGEICVRGHCVMQGYYKKPEATTAVMDAEGWFHTGDLGVLDAQGYLAVTGRKSDMFIVGGSNAYPAEIEFALSEHPLIKQAYVVGVPHPRLGEVGFAFVEPSAGAALAEAEVKAFCRTRLADFKVPHHVVIVSDWPLTATGKVQRFILKERAAQHLAVATAPSEGAASRRDM